MPNNLYDKKKLINKNKQIAIRKMNYINATIISLYSSNKNQLPVFIIVV